MPLSAFLSPQRENMLICALAQIVLQAAVYVNRKFDFRVLRRICSVLNTLGV